MREILFRGRTNYGEWFEGFYVHIPCGRGGIDEHLIQTIKEDGRIDRLTQVVPETVGQYTGLTDKNGKKIFEGDVCRCCLDPEICEGKVEYDNRTASFIVALKDDMILSFLDYKVAQIKVGEKVWVEVVGNIHDNPELLEVKE